MEVRSPNISRSSQRPPKPRDELRSRAKSWRMLYWRVPALSSAARGPDARLEFPYRDKGCREKCQGQDRCRLHCGTVTLYRFTVPDHDLIVMLRNCVKSLVQVSVDRQDLLLSDVPSLFHYAILLYWLWTELSSFASSAFESGDVAWCAARQSSRCQCTTVPRPRTIHVGQRYRL